jgi:hypothetical protein
MSIQFKVSVIPPILVVALTFTALPFIPQAAAADTTPAVMKATAPAAPVAPDIEVIRKTARLLGLTPRRRNGTELYCRSAAELGTLYASPGAGTREAQAIQSV